MPGKEETTGLHFGPLGPTHDRAAFACGIEALDNYLRKQVRQDVKKRVAVAFVLTPDGKTVAGYYTLSQYSVELDAIPGVRDINVTLWTGSFFVASILTYVIR